MGISCWVAHKAVWSPQNVAMRFEGEEISYARFEDRVADYQIPRQVVVVEEFPRTSLGEVQKGESVMVMSALTAAGAADPPD